MQMKLKLKRTTSVLANKAVRMLMSLAVLFCSGGTLTACRADDLQEAVTGGDTAEIQEALTQDNDAAADGSESAGGAYVTDAASSADAAGFGAERIFTDAEVSSDAVAAMGGVPSAVRAADEAESEQTPLKWQEASKISLEAVPVSAFEYTTRTVNEAGTHGKDDFAFTVNIDKEPTYKIPENLAKYEEPLVAKLEKLNLNRQLNVLFYGDSITDAGRNVYAAYDLGVGHAQLLADEILQYTDRVLFYNRGIRGNTVNNLLARYNRDLLALKPDVVVILIGINDLWTYGNDYILDDPVRYADPTLTDLEKDFLNNYEQLLQNIQRDLPGSEIIICSPYVLSNAADYTTLSTHLARRQPHIRALADKYSCAYVDLGTIMQEQSRKQAVSTLAQDGLHPTTVGYKVIKDALLQDVVEAILKVNDAS